MEHTNDPSEKKANLLTSLDQVSQDVEDVLKETVGEIDSLVKKPREVVFRRYPFLFTLLVTFGVAAVFFGFEKILSNSFYLSDKPWLILVIGVLVLAFSGQLYKRLGE